MFAAITVVIALLGLLLLGLSFMHGVALGAAAAVLAVMLAALTVIPALIGGSGPFMDGVLREFDRRGGFRFWGTKRRIHIPGQAWRARRAAPARAQRAAGAGWERWSRRVQRRPWPAAAASLVVLLAPGAPRAEPAAGLERRGRRPARHHDAQGLRPDRPGLRRRHQRLVPARRRARRRKGDKAAAQQIAAARASATTTSRSSRRPRCRPTAAWRRSPPTRGPGRRTRRRPTRSTACATTSSRAVERADRRARRGRRLHRVQRGLLARRGQQAAAVRRRRRPAQRAAAARRLPLGGDPDQGGDHEPAVDRRRARLRHADLPGRPRRGPARDRHRPDRVVRAGADVRDRLRPEHGLRGVPDLARARGVGAHATTPRAPSRAACRPPAG